MLFVKPVLNFPEEKADGAVAWQRRLPGQGPTMAIGSIEFPERSDVELRIAPIDSIFETTSPSDPDVSPGPGCRRSGEWDSAAELPAGGMTSLRMQTRPGDHTHDLRCSQSASHRHFGTSGGSFRWAGRTDSLPVNPRSDLVVVEAHVVSDLHVRDPSFCNEPANVPMTCSQPGCDTFRVEEWHAARLRLTAACGRSHRRVQLPIPNLP